MTYKSHKDNFTLPLLQTQPCILLKKIIWLLAIFLEYLEKIGGIMYGYQNFSHHDHVVSY